MQARACGASFTSTLAGHDRDGALANERDWHRVGAHAVARDAPGGVGGVEMKANEDA
jgi:hypothetical protein